MMNTVKKLSYQNREHIIALYEQGLVFVCSVKITAPPDCEEILEQICCESKVYCLGVRGAVYLI